MGQLGGLTAIKRVTMVTHTGGAVLPGTTLSRRFCSGLQLPLNENDAPSPQ